MVEKQEITVIKPEELLPRVKKFFEEKHRLAAVSCSKLGGALQIDYTFDKDYVFADLRIILPSEKPSLPSITQIYFAAFTYENELHDLFGVKFDGLALDFQGNFYRTQQKTIFNPAGAAAPAPAQTNG
jgi:ech hydrogenase subunit D